MCDDADVDPDGTCVSKKGCDKIDPASTKGDGANAAYATDVKLAKCTHCGAKSWNIHGDSATGYVLTESSSGTQLCLVRPRGTKSARLAPKLVQRLLKEEKMDVNVRDWDELTPIIPAASAGHLDVVKLLLKEARTGVTALWLAAGEGRSDVMRSLLRKDADANNARSDGISALMTASVGGHAEAVKLLLENGADARFADGEGVTPLMNAAENGTTAVLETARESKSARADGGTRASTPTSWSRTGFTALIIASAHGHASAIEYLLKDGGADVNAMHETRVTPLMYAAASGHVDAMRLLLDVGKVDVNELHTNGGSALLEAATGGAGEAMKFLLERGAKPDLVDLDGVTPLHAVTSKGDYNGTIALLEPVRTSAVLDEEERTPLLLAVKGNYGEVASALVRAGADPNTPYVDEEGESHNLLMDSIIAENADFALLLIEHGADVYYMDDHKVTTLLQASHRGIANVTEALLNRHASSPEGGGGELGIDVNSQNVDGHTALMFAYNGKNQEALKNHTMLVDLLLKAGANTALKDKEGHVAKDFDFQPDADGELLEREEKAERKRDESRNEL
ncbi:hypothetical protein ACHAW5_003594 [Stephanodiscus triporus]|uniref:Uncharacterized protein n=1 Tax=Stephanodiscus triporus TaxID=2934178 RepID=A0ABD3N501_9STRA